MPSGSQPYQLNIPISNNKRNILVLQQTCQNTNLPMHKTYPVLFTLTVTIIRRGFAKKTNSEITMEVPGLTMNFFLEIVPK